MKTLEDLKKDKPEVFALHDASINAAVGVETAKVTDLTTKLAASEKTAKAAIGAINTLLPTLKAIEGVELPQREVLPSEHASNVAKLNTEITGLRTELATAKTEKAAAQKLVDDATAEKADATRKTKASEKLAALIKDAKFAGYGKALKLAGEKMLASVTFVEASVEAFLVEKLEEYKLAGIAPGVAAPASTKKGENVTDEDLAAIDAENEDEESTPEAEAARRVKATEKLNAWNEAQAKKAAAAASAAK